jgi:hypothetical protein
VRERDSHRLARFPTRFAGDAHCGEGRRGSDELWTTATLRRDAEGDGELECVVGILDCFQTKVRATAGDAGASGDHRELDWLQNKARKGVREVRRDGGEGLEGVREYGGHRRWRISPRMSAGTAESGDRFRQPCGELSGGKEGERQRGRAAL